MNPHDLFTRVLTATTAIEIDALAELFHPEFVGDSPQSGERVHGFAGFRHQLENYPGDVEVESQSPVTRVVGGEERWAITPNYTVVPLANPNEYTALTRARYSDGSLWWDGHPGHFARWVDIPRGVLLRSRAFARAAVAGSLDAPRWA